MSFLRASRLREAAAPGWQIPGWLIEVARPRSESAPWGEMLRAALAICVPLAVAIALGQPLYGLLAAMGGLLAAVVDRGGPYLGRVRSGERRAAWAPLPREDGLAPVTEAVRAVQSAFLDPGA